MSRDIIFVALGGMLGCVCRFLAVAFVVRLFPSTFPFGTFAVNCVGCFVMGAVVGLAERFIWLDHDWRLFLTVGFCGGFTTFSAFAFENVELLIIKEYTTFAAYSAATFLVCIVFAYLGLIAARP